jgi:hypothetical protein
MPTAAGILDQVAPLTGAQIDPLRSEVLRTELPGLRDALDEQTMRPRLQALLFGESQRYQIARCNPGQAIYLGGDFCGLRYEMEVNDIANQRMLEQLVIGRVFQQHDACAAFMRDKLAPVVERMRGREDLMPFVTPAAVLEDLNMLVHVFPIDGDIPAIGEVTDRQQVIKILSETLPTALEGQFTICDCQVDLAHYGRQHRCTLRYTLAVTSSDGAIAQQVVYGKIAADGSGQRTIPMIAALHERLAATDGASRFNIPRVLGFRPDLQLLLLEAIPGKPWVAQLLKARLAGEDATPPGALTLEDAIATCGRIAAILHTSAIGLGQPRTLADELAWSDHSIQALRRVSPDLGARLQTWREQIAAYAGRAEPLAACLSHGDFTYTQLIFDGTTAGLVDFDTLCQAEPALDLGQFLAYQRLAILKDQRREAPMSADAIERLCGRFLDVYVAAVGVGPAEEQRLRVRAHVYEILMLLRLAVHSWQKLKVSRLAHAITLLEERIACLP